MCIYTRTHPYVYLKSPGLVAQVSSHRQVRGRALRAILGGALPAAPHGGRQGGDVRMGQQPQPLGRLGLEKGYTMNMYLYIYIHTYAYIYASM